MSEEVSTVDGQDGSPRDVYEGTWVIVSSFSHIFGARGN